MRQYYVYMLASPSRVLYVGVTNNLGRRLAEHRDESRRGFTHHYGVVKLVYFETTANAVTAITREKQLKKWPRWRKVRLIERANASWRDLHHPDG
jgi:putative endonuclease